MEHAAHLSRPVDPGDTEAFAVWLGRALRSCHEDTIHESIPAELLAMLPPARAER